jgi:broad specificity phosphatase PhoE
MEWDYGDCEGLTSLAIRARRPDWELFSDGCPGGETVEQIARRATAFRPR